MSDWNQLLIWLDKKYDKAVEMADYETACAYNGVIKYIRDRLGYWLVKEGNGDEKVAT